MLSSMGFPALSCTNSRITSYNVCYTKLLRTLEAWTEYANPTTPLTSWGFAAGDNWAFDPLDVGDNSHITRGTDTQAGTYAVEMLVLASGNGERGFIYQTITAAAGTSVDLSVYTKTSDAQTPYLICLDGVDVAMTQQYDFVADSYNFV